LARGGQVQIWRCWLRGIGAAGDVVGSGIACTSCAAAADAVRVGVGALVVFGDYQIAPKPPGGRLWLVAADAAGVWGTPPAGGGWGVSCPGTSNFLFL